MSIQFQICLILCLLFYATKNLSSQSCGSYSVEFKINVATTTSFKMKVLEFPHTDFHISKRGWTESKKGLAQSIHHSKLGALTNELQNYRSLFSVENFTILIDIVVNKQTYIFEATIQMKDCKIEKTTIPHRYRITHTLDALEIRKLIHHSRAL